MKWWFVVVVVLLVGCRNSRKVLLPESIGNPYEVLVVSDDSIWAGIVSEELKTPVYGLPQEEPSFDVSTVDARHLNGTLRTTRNIVIVRSAGAKDAAHGMRVQHDVHSSPQIQVVIDASSAEQLRKQMHQNGRKLRRVLTENEMKVAHEELASRHNEVAEQTIQRMFSVEMLIPADLTSSKVGQDFLWLSNNSADAMQNICIYIYKKGVDLQDVNWVSVRDSVMRANIPGEEPGMYMRTVNEKNECLVVGRMEGQRYSFSGLWEMKGDMMGGPFSSVAIADTVNRRIVVAEAFVYAPGRPKRNLMMSLLPVLSPVNIHLK